MNLSEDLAYLSNFKQFGRFLAEIKRAREDAISDLHEADIGKIQQISGQIFALDALLKLTNADAVIQKTEDMP